MGWGPVEHQPHTPSTTSHAYGLLVGPCPPALHVLEAYNHKVDHDTHKELNTQEHAVLQYTHTLQYISYCNDARYKDR